MQTGELTYIKSAPTDTMLTKFVLRIEAHHGLISHGIFLIGIMLHEICVSAFIKF